MLSTRILIIAFILILLSLGLAVWANTSVLNLNQKMKAQQVNSFQDCLNAGYPVQQSAPRTCVVSKTKTFTEEASDLPQDPATQPPTDFSGGTQ